MPLLDHHGGHHLNEGLCCDLRCSESKVGHRTQFLHQPRVRTTLVQLFQCLCLVYLQDDHGMQGGSGLARSAISLGSQGYRQLTGFGWEAWTVPPVGGVLRAQVHHNRSLHLGNINVPPGRPTIEGGEEGRAQGRSMFW